MARLATFAFVSWLLTVVSCLQEFINPPAFGETGDFSSNPIYTEDAKVNIAWTEGESGKKCSLVLYQLNETDGQPFGDWEFLTRDAVDVTSYSWLVGTGKNLSESNLFFFSYYQEGKTVSNMNSHYFNIEAKDAKDSSASSSSSTSTSSSSTLSSSASSVMLSASSTASPSISTSTLKMLSSSSPTSEPTSTSSSINQSSSSPQSSDGLNMGALIGLGVGILVALIMCLVAGFLLFRRRKKRDSAPTATPSSPQNDYRHHDGSYYGSNLNEAPLRSPVEMGQHTVPYVTHHDLQAKQPVCLSAEPVRYEM